MDRHIFPGKPCLYRGCTVTVLALLKDSDKDVVLLHSGLVVPQDELSAFDGSVVRHVISRRAFYRLCCEGRMMEIGDKQSLVGKVLLLVSNDGMFVVRGVAVVDGINDLVFDQDGGVVNLKPYFVFDTGFCLERNEGGGFLTEMGERAMQQSYPE